MLLLADPISFIMKKPILLLCLLVAFNSCNDSKKAETDSSTEDKENIEYKDDLGSSAQDQPMAKDKSQASSEDRKTEDYSENKSASISGVYYNSSHKGDTECNCYCVDISATGSSELCLKENELYINALFKKNGDNINIYYKGKSEANTNEEIPWDKFETGTPIAVLSPEPNGVLKLDWKGFRIDGKIAIDYALLGKKTLEGTYKKK